jgi:hypothetical protein
MNNELLALPRIALAKRKPIADLPTAIQTVCRQKVIGPKSNVDTRARSLGNRLKSLG